MRGRHVDEDGGRGFIDLKAPREAVDRGEEDLAGHEIGRPHSVGADVAPHLEHALDLGGEEYARQQYAREPAERKVVRRDDHPDRRHHPARRGRRMTALVEMRNPTTGADPTHNTTSRQPRPPYPAERT